MYDCSDPYGHGHTVYDYSKLATVTITPTMALTAPVQPFPTIWPCR